MCREQAEQRGVPDRRGAVGTGLPRHADLEQGQRPGLELPCLDDGEGPWRRRQSTFEADPTRLHDECSLCPPRLDQPQRGVQVAQPPVDRAFTDTALPLVVDPGVEAGPRHTGDGRLVRVELSGAHQEGKPGRVAARPLEQRARAEAISSAARLGVEPGGRCERPLPGGAIVRSQSDLARERVR